MDYTTLIVLTGSSLLGACAGLVGTFAVLRKRALTSDALSHAALPGLCIAFLILGEKNLHWMLFGAFVSGVLGVALISRLPKISLTREDAAIGLVLSLFFGIGIVLKRIIQDQTTSGSKAGLNNFIFGNTAGMLLSDIILISIVSAICLIAILVLYKEIRAVSFDFGFLAVQGWPAGRLDFLLMILIAVTVIASLPTVGVIMTAALMILPATSARFWTNELGLMLILSASFGIITGICGTLISAQFVNMPAGAITILVGTTLFLLSMFFAPKRGLVSRIVSDRRFQIHVQGQRILMNLFRPTRKVLLTKSNLASLGNLAHRALGKLSQNDLVQVLPNGTLQLTSNGQEEASEIYHAKQIWELYISRDAESAASITTLDFLSLKQELPEALWNSLSQEVLQMQSEGPSR